MDSALSLRIVFERGIALDDTAIEEHLNSSALVKKLTADYIEHPLFAVFRIMGISEIPHMERLPYTRRLLEYINSNIATKEGFAPLGGVNEIVPCYNAMLLQAYCRLGFHESAQAQAALGWIKHYQLFERNSTSAWQHEGVCKHGGCLRNTPCYIGIGKTVLALIDYHERVNDSKVEALLKQGVSYMLHHNMYLRLSSDMPISSHITDIMMPQNYALSLTDLVYIIGKKGLQNEHGTERIVQLLKEKQSEPDKWKIDYLYKYRGYVPFEGRRKTSEWISQLFSIWLEALVNGSETR
ncbi:MAG: hypothetical protein LBR98_08865 [Syntrophomonadaceae bacterium]|jgi:hypothetical protein|nr:hypothetical protein [Syntrophomonadaceae bacterium]